MGEREPHAAERRRHADQGEELHELAALGPPRRVVRGHEILPAS